MNTQFTKLLRARPLLIFWSYSLNVALSAYLLFIGARIKVLVLGGIFCAAALGFVYLCVKSGFVIFQGRHITADEAPRGFWFSMIICYGAYLTGTVFTVLLHLQDISRGRIH